MTKYKTTKVLQTITPEQCNLYTGQIKSLFGRMVLGLDGMNLGANFCAREGKIYQRKPFLLFRYERPLGDEELAHLFPQLVEPLKQGIQKCVDDISQLHEDGREKLVSMGEGMHLLEDRLFGGFEELHELSTQEKRLAEKQEEYAQASKRDAPDISDPSFAQTRKQIYQDRVEHLRLEGIAKPIPLKLAHQTQSTERMEEYLLGHQRVFNALYFITECLGIVRDQAEIAKLQSDISLDEYAAFWDIVSKTNQQVRNVATIHEVSDSLTKTVNEITGRKITPPMQRSYAYPTGIE